MKWFGTAHGAAYEADTPHVDTPVGDVCARCREPIGDTDDGFLMPAFSAHGPTIHAYHYECRLRSVVGGLNHQLGQCTCSGGTEPPDPSGMTRREAARAAVEHWRTTNDQLRKSSR